MRNFTVGAVILETESRIIIIVELLKYAASG